MALSSEYIEYLDSLDDELLLALLSFLYGQTEYVWEEITKEEYDKNFGDLPWEEKLFSFNGHYYKKEPHWKNVQAGIMWQIEHYANEPDYYTYYKSVGQRRVLLLGADMTNYVTKRFPEKIWK